MRDLSISSADFGALLSWLDSNPEIAAARYEKIRHGLIRIFVSRGYAEAEELADETINRVALRVGDIRNSYIGNPELYFYGVARKLLREHTRAKRDVSDKELEGPPIKLECVQKCLEALTPDDQHLIVEYYRKESGVHEDARVLLAQQIGVSANSLRIRALRIRKSFQKCVVKCLHKDATSSS